MPKLPRFTFSTTKQNIHKLLAYARKHGDSAAKVINRYIDKLPDYTSEK